MCLSCLLFLLLVGSPCQVYGKPENRSLSQRTWRHTEKLYGEFLHRLWDLDVNGMTNASMRLNLQSRTTRTSKDDFAPSPLFQFVDESFLFSQPTVAAFLNLLDNYIPETSVPEFDSPEKSREIAEFLEAVCNTTVLLETLRFLQSIGQRFSEMGDLRAYLAEAWFSPYSRSGKAGRLPDSSGFEHVFVGETKKRPREITGMHNWIQAYLMEKSGRFNYKGYIGSYSELPPGRYVFGASMDAFENLPKRPFGTFIFGSSLEFDVAAFTVCSIIRPNKACRFSINGKHIRIRNRRIGKSTLIAAAFPQI